MRLKSGLLSLILLAFAATARAGWFGWVDYVNPRAPQPGSTFDAWTYGSYTGGLRGGTIEAQSPVWSGGFYRMGVRGRVWHSEQLKGTEEEGSFWLSRELYHLTVKGRLGSAPPNSQSASYHLAEGEAAFHFYGLEMGPEHPELAASVWESSGPAPAQFDRTWVGLLRGRYTNTDHHIYNPGGNIFVVVENAFQFELRETYKDAVSLAFFNGIDRYNKPLFNQSRRILKQNIDIPGDPMAHFGWPNNWIGGEVWVRYEGWKLAGSASRVNLLDNELQTNYGGELERELDKHWKLRAGYFHHRRRGIVTREASTLGVSYVW